MKNPSYFSATRYAKFSWLTALMLVLLPLTACGDSPTATPVPTTAAATTAPATTTAATTIAATTAATTVVATTTVPVTTTAATTAAATTSKAASTPTAVRTVPLMATVGRAPVPTAAPTTPSANPTTPAQPRPTLPPPDPSSKADPLLVSIISLYTKTQGTDDQKLKAARDFAIDIEALIEDQDEIALDIEVASTADIKPVSDKIVAMGGSVDDTEEIVGTHLLLASVPLKIFVTYANPTTKDNFLRDLGGTAGVKLINLPFAEDTKELKGLPNNIDALRALFQANKNQGVKVMGADKWQAVGITGKGVTVGIIDSGYRFHQQLRGTALPVDFKVEDFSQKLLKEDSIEKSVHGTAVAEIIYSVASDAKLIATSISGTDAEFSEAIDYLVAQKVDFISVSMGNNSEAEDGQSALSKKVEEVNKQTGIVFFMASGNEGQEHYAGIFAPDVRGSHQWIPKVDRMAIGNPTDQPLPSTVLLRWDQWLNGGVNPQATDFDLVIEDASGAVLFVSDADQRSRPPLEAARLNIPPKALIYIKVRVKDGTPMPEKPVRLHIFVTGGIPPQFLTPVMTVGTSADSKGAIAVGSIDPPDGDLIATYSSQGPLSDGRLKPEIVAPGGVNSAAYEANGGSVFNGTSAATPQVSGLAALIKSGNLTLTPAEVVQILLENAKAPAGAQLPNSVYGYGRADVSNLPPGPVKPKGSLAPLPAPNLNPPLPLDIVTGYPAPVQGN